MAVLIVFNVLLVAALACLVKPDLLARYTGGKPVPRWVFVVALVVLVSLRPFEEPSRHVSERRLPVLEQTPARQAAPVAAAPAGSSVVELAAESEGLR